VSRQALLRRARNRIHGSNGNGTGNRGKWSIPVVAVSVQTRYGGLDMATGSEPITELRKPDGADLDLRPTVELVQLINAEDASAARAAGAGAPYALGAARAAADAGALTVAVVCVEGSELGRLVEHELVAVTGPEVIAGSTRMKAGTAQKLILNTISTVAMVRLG